jgi:hypothetical protein
MPQRISLTTVDIEYDPHATATVSRWRAYRFILCVATEICVSIGQADLTIAIFKVPIETANVDLGGHPCSPLTHVFYRQPTHQKKSFRAIAAVRGYS